MVVVVRNRRCAFGLMPKAGSHSLKQWLMNHHDGEQFGKHHGVECPDGDWNCYVLVRDPIERLGSLWVYETHNPKNRHKSPGTWQWGFRQWMETRIFGRWRESPMHDTACQWLETMNAVPLKIEVINEDLDRNGFHGPPLTVENAGIGKPYSGKFCDSASKEDIEMILEYCEQDFEALGYPKPAMQSC